MGYSDQNPSTQHFKDTLIKSAKRRVSPMQRFTPTGHYERKRDFSGSAAFESAPKSA